MILKQAFNWWVGVVEDRNDPEKLGRVRVRVIGYHTDNRSVLSTEDLPWAIIMQPSTSAAISGIGSAPVGLMTGSWVVGFFLDGDDMQQPIIMGSLGGMPAPLPRYCSPQEKKPRISRCSIIIRCNYSSFACKSTRCNCN